MQLAFSMSVRYNLKMANSTMFREDKIVVWRTVQLILIFYWSKHTIHYRHKRNLEVLVNMNSSKLQDSYILNNGHFTHQGLLPENEFLPHVICSAIPGGQRVPKVIQWPITGTIRSIGAFQSWHLSKTWDGRGKTLCLKPIIESTTVSLIFSHTSI